MPFKIEISLTDFYDVRLHGQVWVENESKVPGRIREGDVFVREGNSRRFQWKWKGKERIELLFCRRSIWADFQSSMFLCRLCMHWVLWWGLFTSLRGADFWSCVSSAKSWWFTEWLAMISERGVVYRTKRMGPTTEPLVTQYMSCDGDEDDWSGLISVWEIWLKPSECSRLKAKNRVQAGEGNLVVNSVGKLQQGEQKWCHCPERREYCLQCVTKRCHGCVPALQADWRGLLRLVSWRWEGDLCRTTFSKISDRNGRLKTGR